MNNLQSNRPATAIEAHSDVPMLEMRAMHNSLRNSGSAKLHANAKLQAKGMTAVAAIALAILFALTPAYADATQQQVFPTPEAAGKALVTAAEADDLKTLSSILGQDAADVLSSGDPVADNNSREEFVRRYHQMHRYAYDDDGRVILYIGAANWPTPIPLIKQDGGWVFDTAAGKNELLYRRIGKNEMFTINVLHDLAAAQDEYSALKNQYAQKILSDPDQQNGLYWQSPAGQPESPIGPLVASAQSEGYKRGENNAPIPFHGYYYRVLTMQGKGAHGGAMRYIVDGKMTRGFAFLAYPADYRSSGVMTFMVNQDGVVVQKDLGPKTQELASKMTEFNPNKTWDEVLPPVASTGD
jgi:hypothetical protein